MGRSYVFFGLAITQCIVGMARIVLRRMANNNFNAKSRGRIGWMEFNTSCQTVFDMLWVLNFQSVPRLRRVQSLHSTESSSAERIRYAEWMQCGPINGYTCVVWTVATRGATHGMTTLSWKHCHDRSWSPQRFRVSISIQSSRRKLSFGPIAEIET